VGPWFLTPLCSDNQTIKVPGGQLSALFRNFLEVLIPGAFFMYFCGFGASPGGHWLPKGPHLEHLWDSNSGELASIYGFGLPGGSKTSQRVTFRWYLGALWEQFGRYFDYILEALWWYFFE